MGGAARCSSTGDSAKSAPAPEKTASPKATPSKSAEEKAKGQILAAYEGMHTVETEAYRTGKLDNASLQKYARAACWSRSTGTNNGA
ncbi:hypothetical protein GCM10010277_82210 [Streptomyces longisporoflavus]|nr:hypothetical protein GCM10010277_82210 [Streptomyces longisporoflavus]